MGNRETLARELAPPWRRYLWLAAATLVGWVFCDSMRPYDNPEMSGQNVFLTRDGEREDWACESPLFFERSHGERIGLAIIEGSDKRAVGNTGFRVLDAATAAFRRRSTEVSARLFPNAGMQHAALTSEDIGRAYVAAILCRQHLALFPVPGKSAYRVDWPMLGWGASALACAVLTLGFVVTAVVRRTLSKRWISRYLNNRCVDCGYDLSPSPHGVCPECGKPCTE
jgi:hypothetical protein